MKKIALITSGGDAPGMNACIRAVVKSALNQGISVLGIYDGYQGMIEQRGKWMTFDDVNNIIQNGGTILGTARSNEFRTTDGRQMAINYLKKEGIEGLIVIGGDGSFAGADLLSKEMDIHIIGIPGTIDNDIYGTDHTIGYDTALNTVVSAVDKIRDTASSHHRVFFVEVMGRDAGFIALNTAIASGAEDVLIPEEITDISHLVKHIKEGNSGRRSTIIIVAEGDDAGGAMEIIDKVKPHLPEFELRCSILGHIQRGGSPSALDRIIATRMGVAAVELLINGRSQQMIGMKGEELFYTSISESTKLHSKPDMAKITMLDNLRTKSK
jgi:6-phosphofructokinase 1